MERPENRRRQEGTAEVWPSRRRPTGGRKEGGRAGAWGSCGRAGGERPRDNALYSLVKRTSHTGPCKSAGVCTASQGSVTLGPDR